MILSTIERLPKDADGKPRFKEKGVWSCEPCAGEGFIMNEKGFYEPCATCEGTGVLKGELQ